MASVLPAAIQRQAQWVYDPSRSSSLRGSPFKLLYVADFGSNELSTGQANLGMPLPVVSFTELIRFYRPSLNLTLDGSLIGSDGVTTAKLVPADIGDFFDPSSALVRSEEEISWSGRALQDLASRLPKRYNGQCFDQFDDLPDAERQLVKVLDKRGDLSHSDEVRFELNEAVVKGDKLFRLINDAVEQSEEWNALARNWLGLDLLLKDVLGLAGVELWVLNMGMDALVEDAQNQVSKSDLYEAIYSTELGQYGGHPFSLVFFADPLVSPRNPDGMLEFIAQVGEASSVPVVLELGLSHLGLKDLRDLDILEASSGSNLKGQRSLVDSTWSQFVFLTSTFTRYKAELIRKRSLESGRQICVEFETGAGLELCRHMANYFGREIPDEFVPQVHQVRYTDTILYWVSPTVAQVLADSGVFARVCDHPDLGSAFPWVYALARGLAPAKGESSGDPTKDSCPEMRDLIAMLRIIHSLKTWAREEIGSTSSQGQRVGRLNERLGQFVLDSANPHPMALANRPLRLGRISQIDNSNSEDPTFLIELRLHPRLTDNEPSLSTQLSLH